MWNLWEQVFTRADLTHDVDGVSPSSSWLCSKIVRRAPPDRASHIMVKSVFMWVVSKSESRLKADQSLAIFRQITAKPAQVPKTYLPLGNENDTLFVNLTKHHMGHT
jgi:hypothetical protein